MTFNVQNPLVVQSDKTVLLEVQNDLYEEARDALARFAELEKSPEYLHTYRITPLSLWNAAAAGLDAAEGHGGPVGEAQGEDRPGDVRAEGHDPGGPADLHAAFQKLFRYRGLTVDGPGGAEDVEVLFLIFCDQVYGFLEPGELANGGGPVWLRRAWKAASADSFMGRPG